MLLCYNIFMQIMYILNIIVAGWISITSLFYPKTALYTVFENSIQYSESIRLVGALWLSIALISILGLVYPKQMQLIFLVQLIYKSSWILVVATPALIQGSNFPKGMALTFLVWIVILPFIIDWNYLFK
jgi:hypothetical protein